AQIGQQTLAPRLQLLAGREGGQDPHFGPHRPLHAVDEEGIAPLTAKLAVAGRRGEGDLRLTDSDLARRGIRQGDEKQKQRSERGDTAQDEPSHGGGPVLPRDGESIVRATAESRALETI